MAVAKKPAQKPTVASASAPVASAPVVAAPVASAPVAPASAPVVSAPAPVVASEPAASVSVADKAAQIFNFPAQTELLKPLNDMQEQFRAGTEKGLEHLRAHYSTLKTNAETATDKLEESIAAAQAGTKAFQAKVVDLFRAQADANFTHLRDLFGAKSLPEALKLQQDFAQAQVAAIQSETRNLAELAQKVAGDVVEPVKTSLVASFKG